MYYTIISLALVAFSACAAKTAPQPVKEMPKQAASNNYDAVKLHDEADKTDLFAIPLDTSEMEEEAEKK